MRMQRRMRGWTVRGLGCGGGLREDWELCGQVESGNLPWWLEGQEESEVEL
jgi:hypothetical protein